MHQLGENANGLTPAPANYEEDPVRVDENYPGFVTYTECRRHQEDGKTWCEVLSDEID